MEIITGVLSTHDVSLDGDSLKCATARLAVDIGAQGIPATTFCSTKFVEERKGMVQAAFSILGYTTDGDTVSDPLQFVLNEDPIAFVGTAKTGCSISFSANIFGDGMDLVAAFNSGRTITGRSTGDITGVWVTT